MKVLLIIPDGLGDRPAPTLNGKTPLEAAHTPNMDALAQAGINGLYSVFGPGIPVGSPVALHVMFGYPPEEFPDRGVLLSVARGLETNYDDVVLSARLASVRPENGRLRLLARFIRDEEEVCETLASEIAHYETDGPVFRYIYCGKGDGNLYISGNASSHITDSDPLGLDLPVIKVEPTEDAPDPSAARRTATALNRYLSWAYRRMSNHPIASKRQDEELMPINFLITKWSGKRRKLEPFLERYGLQAASLPDEEVVKGVVSELSMHVVDMPRIMDTEEDIRQRLSTAEKLFSQGYDFVHLHTKEPDFTSHWNDPVRTKEALDAWDRGFAFYWERLGRDDDLLTILTSDHSTPSQWLDLKPGEFNDQHAGEPCPITIKGRHVRKDDVKEAGERPAATGGLGLVRGGGLMDLMLSLTDRTNLYGMRPTPRSHNYRPREVEPFQVLPD
ncbi:MAG: hypothetical protein ACE5KI_03160 [Dehalococcoidia bacterium]